MKLILYNDDFGATHGLTDAVKQSFLNGTTTSASVRTNGAAFRYAVEEVLPAIPGLEVGLHVNLTEGPPQASPAEVPRLIDPRGFLKRSFVDYYLSARHDAEVLKQVEIEIRAQFEKAAGCGLRMNHVNGHQHVHMIPGIFEMVCRMMTDYGMKFIRIPSEPFFVTRRFLDNHHMVSHLNPVKHWILRRLTPDARRVMEGYGLKCVGCFVGVLYTGRMNLGVLKKAVEKIEKRCIDAAEVLFHPADTDHEKDQGEKGVRIPRYYYLKERRLEKESLLSSEMREFLEIRKIQLVTHSDLERSGFPGWNVRM